MRPRHVYIDVENTLTVPFLSGIQRVTIELVRQLSELPQTNWRFIPVNHCSLCDGWIPVELRRLTRIPAAPALPSPVRRILLGARRIVSATPIKPLLKPAYTWIRHPKSVHARQIINELEADSVFLDIDSSWHNELKRTTLLPKLKQSNISIINLHHDAIPILMPDLTHENTVRVFTEYFHAHLHFSDLIICTSKTVETDLLKIADTKSVHIKATDTLRLGEFATDGSKQIGSWPLPGNVDRFLLYVATVEARKNHTLLLDAFDRISESIPDTSLVLVGRKGWRAEQVVERITSHKLFNSRIFWIENIDDNTLARLYSKAELCVFTSLYEGFGLPLSEGLCNGCITISTNAGALPETGENYADYVDPGDTDTLCRLIRKYLLNPGARKEKRMQISTRAVRSWVDVAEDLVAILDRHLQSPH